MKRRSALLALVALVAAIWVVFAPHRFTDADTLSRLATGRYIVTHGELPRHDPFTFARPDAPLGHSEWLGDVIAYACYARFGEGGLQDADDRAGHARLRARVRVRARARRAGAAGAGAAADHAVGVGATASRRATTCTRCGCCRCSCGFCCAAQRRDRAWSALLALGALWSNLHSSFVLGWALLLAAFVERRLQREPLRAVPIVGAGRLSALAAARSGASSAYAQLWDHFAGAPVYRSLIEEWHSPLTSTARCSRSCRCTC